MTRLRISIAFALALTLGVGVAFAQVPPTGSGPNGWLNAIYNQLGGTAASPGPSSPITATFSGADTASAAATLAAAAGKTTFICGFAVGGLGATAIGNVVATVTGLTGAATLNYTYSMPAGATVPASPVIVQFNPCLPGNAVNTAIVVTVPGAAGNTSTTISAQGYQR